MCPAIPKLWTFELFLPTKVLLLLKVQLQVHYKQYYIVNYTNAYATLITINRSVTLITALFTNTSDTVYRGYTTYKEMYLKYKTSYAKRE